MKHKKLPFTINVVSIEEIVHRMSNHYQLMLILSGEVELEHLGEKKTLQKNDVYCFNLMESFCMKGKGHNMVVMLEIQCSEFANLTNNQEEIHLKAQVMHTRQVEKLKGEIITLVLEHYKGSLFNCRILKCYYSVLDLALSIYRDFETRITIREDLHIKDKRIQHIIDTINEHYAEHLSLQEFADEHYMASSYLSRLFKNESGLSFSKYVQKVRLKNAIWEMTNTNKSLYDIALDAGFPNVKSFFKTFKHATGTTPKQYRMQTQLQMVTGENHSILNTLDKKTIFHELSHYMETEQIDFKNETSEKELTIELGQGVKRERNKRILLIGDIKNGAIHTVQKQIVTLQEELQFDIIHFENFLEETTYLFSNEMVSDFICNKHWFDFIVHQRLCPMISVNYSLFDEEQVLQPSYKKLLHYLYNRYSEDMIPKWYFEITLDGRYDSMENIQQFNAIKEQISEILHPVSFGICLVLENSSDFLEKKQMLEHLIQQDITVDFVNIRIRSNQQTSYSLAKMMQAFKHICETSMIEINLLEWNTIIGEGDILSGTFFRTSLIVKALVELEEIIFGVGFWLNINLSSKTLQPLGISSLTLYMYDHIKRPVYFALKLFFQLGEEVIHKRSDCIVTKKNRQLQVMAYNANFLDPLYSLDEYLVSTQNIIQKITLKGLASKDYMIKIHTLSKDQGGIYNQWINMGSIREIDKETQKYWELITQPKLSVEFKSVDNDEMKLESYLTFNACQLFSIKPIYLDK